MQTPQNAQCEFIKQIKCTVCHLQPNVTAPGPLPGSPPMTLVPALPAGLSCAPFWLLPHPPHTPPASPCQTLHILLRLTSGTLHCPLNGSHQGHSRNSCCSVHGRLPHQEGLMSPPRSTWHCGPHLPLQWSLPCYVQVPLCPGCPPPSRPILRRNTLNPLNTRALSQTLSASCSHPLLQGGGGPCGARSRLPRICRHCRQDR